MSNWQRELNLLPEWEQAKNREITPSQLAKVIGERILALKPFDKHSEEELERVFLGEDFLDMATDPRLRVEDFDIMMESLYDWGDTPLDDNLFGGKKVCWIKTS